MTSEKRPAELIAKVTGLISNLTSALQELSEPETGAQLKEALHNHERLPDRELAKLAAQATDKLHEIGLLLEPDILILADHFFGYLDTKCLVAAVDLDIPDVLGDSALTVAELAKECGARPDRLRQILRLLRNKGIFSYDEATDRYSNNSTSQLLLKDHWTQWRNWVDMYGNEMYDMARGIPQQCRAGETRMAGQIEYKTDKSMFQFFVDTGRLPRMHKTLSGGATAQAPGIVADYPWHEVAQQTVIDIGGGQGGLLASLLKEHPHMTGGILDIGPVIERAKQSFHHPDGVYADVGSQVPSENLITGDFLVSVPSSEVYTMKWCLHDWDDSKALTVLKVIRKAIKRGPSSRLIVLESLLADGRSSRLTRYGDLTMMISANGQERDESEWISLAERTGWKLNRVFHLRNAWPAAIELVPAWEGATADGTVGHNTTDLLPNDLNVSAEMGFLEKWDPAKGEPFYRSAAEEGLPSMNFGWSQHKVNFTDSRPVKDQFTIEKNGFQYIDDTQGISPSLLAEIRRNDKENTAKLYYPRVEALVKKHTGASRVVIFDNTVRKRDPELDQSDNPNGREQPATTVHCDQSGKGAKGRLAQNLRPGETLEEVLRGRVQLINVWRPLVGPVVDWPLATMDALSLKPEHAHPVSLYRGTWTDRGQTMTFEYDEAQRWYYLRHHRVDEVTMIKIWDSWGKLGGEVAECCPHAAFKHPGTPEGARPRESIEVRCLALFDPEP